jgi:predicted RNA-binding protein (virulence factor B family)
MPHRLLGLTAAMEVERTGPPGAFLIEPGGDGREAILLPRAEAGDAPLERGQRVEVFVYLDSEERPTATLRRPRLCLGEVAFLRVTAVNHVGAFVDWGLGKELLVPFAEQTAEAQPGDLLAIGLYLDSSGRLAGTMRVSEMLEDGGPYELDQWVEGEAWRKRDGLGVFVILDRKHVGLLPHDEPHRLKRGEAARFRVASVLPDGKIELSLRDLAHNEVEGDARALLAYLADPGKPRLGDRSPPEQIRSLVGLSKKAFKRALGRLLQQRLVDIDAQGLAVIVADRDTSKGKVKKALRAGVASLPGACGYAARSPMSAPSEPARERPSPLARLFVTPAQEGYEAEIEEERGRLQRAKGQVSGAHHHRLAGRHHAAFFAICRGDQRGAARVALLHQRAQHRHPRGDDRDHDGALQEQPGLAGR